jgi:hypothetical protein
VSLIATTTPQFIHELVNKRRGRVAEDTFATFYRVNTRRDQLKYATKSGFKLIEFDSYEGRPEYLRHFGILYYIGIGYERVINKFNINNLKAIHISVFQK